MKKILSLKTHDCHILLHRLLPIVVQAFLSKNVHTVVTELCCFFRDLCTRRIWITDLDRLQADIISILYKLKRIFPSRLFDVMAHLAVHMPCEIKVTDLVNYSWMYPIERSLCTMKQFVPKQSTTQWVYCRTICDDWIRDFLFEVSKWDWNLIYPSEQNDDNILDDEVLGEFEVFV